MLCEIVNFRADIAFRRSDPPQVRAIGGARLVIGNRAGPKLARSFDVRLTGNRRARGHCTHDCSRELDVAILHAIRFKTRN
jgi:hypothetical protein